MKELKIHLIDFGILTWQKSPCGIPIKNHLKYTYDRDKVTCLRCKKTNLFRNLGLALKEGRPE